MEKYTFKRDLYDKNGNLESTITIETRNITTYSLLEDFEDFLSACGFQLKGSIEINEEVEDENSLV